MLTPAYETDRSWADGFLPRVREIVGPLLLVPATPYQDEHEATDLIIRDGDVRCIAVRVRRAKYAGLWPDDFTVRSRRPTGARPELSKIIDGWGDWLFYGYDDGTGADFNGYMIVDLDELRTAFIRRPSLLRFEGRRSGEKISPDGTGFAWFNVSHLPAACLIRRVAPAQVTQRAPEATRSRASEVTA